MTDPSFPPDYILGGFCEVKEEQFRFEAWSKTKLSDEEVFRAFRTWLSRQPDGRIPKKGLTIRIAYQADMLR
jgi:hypothetical protein